MARTRNATSPETNGTEPVEQAGLVEVLTRIAVALESIDGKLETGARIAQGFYKANGIALRTEIVPWNFYGPYSNNTLQRRIPALRRIDSDDAFRRKAKELDGFLPAAVIGRQGWLVQGIFVLQHGLPLPPWTKDLKSAYTRAEIDVALRRQMSDRKQTTRRQKADK